MKLLVAISFLTLAFAWEDGKMLKNWQKVKAMESCWGEENMKLYTVNIKKAIAKCGHEDAPELALAPFRSTYRFVNAMLNSERHNEHQMFEIIKMMRNVMQEGQYNSHRHYTPYNRQGSENNWMDNMKNRFFMKQMMKHMKDDDMDFMEYNQRDNKHDMVDVFNRMVDNKMDMRFRNNPESRMSQIFDMFSRNKRAAAQNGVSTANLDLGDRLVEKLNEKKEQMEAKIGNMTCVLKEMGCLNHNNEIDLQGMKDEIKQYAMPSPWFAQRYEQTIDVCYEMANNLPNQIEDHAEVTGDNFGTINLAKVKTFMKCCNKAETKLCMNYDIKKKIESNFGPLDEILEQTQLTEYQLFPLVIQLLYGDEMEYVGGEEL